MEISQWGLSALYLYALILGFFFGAVYDGLRITRVFLGVRYSRRAAKRLERVRLPLLSPRKKSGESRLLGVIVFFEDLFFCLFAGVALILLFYAVNNGKIRVLAFVSCGAGFLAYRVTLGRVVMLFSQVIAFAVECVVRYALFFLSYPFVFAARKMRSAGKKACRAVAERKRIQKRRRFTERETARLARDACGMIADGESIPKRPRKGKRIAKSAKSKEAIQPDATDANSFGNFDRGIHWDICQ